ncbi:MAG: hypothetical protein NUV73_04140 [Candidatus Daviesbacteria bacterium]|nr:hypothetical protein [Candidatus Daviesbacteria bacterium]
MDSFSELQSTVQSDLTVGSESTLFPIATIKLAINRAYRKAGGLFRWPETEDAKKTSTVSAQEYYDYPDNWRPDSIWKVMVDDIRIGEDPDGSPLAYDDYLNWKEDNDTSTDKKWASQWRRFFLWPVPTTSGSNNICVWGQKVVDALVDDDDTTIFSYSMPECNDAIVLEATAILRAKGEDIKTTEFKSSEAKQILAIAFTKVRQEQAKYEKIQPFFHVSDMFSKNSTKEQITGNF